MLALQVRYRRKTMNLTRVNCFHSGGPFHLQPEIMRGVNSVYTSNKRPLSQSVNTGVGGVYLAAVYTCVKPLRLRSQPTWWESAPPVADCADETRRNSAVIYQRGIAAGSQDSSATDVPDKTNCPPSRNLNARNLSF